LADFAPPPIAPTLAEDVRRTPGLLWASGVAAVAVALVLSAGVILGRRPFDFDRAILLALRVPGDPGVPLGPDWLRRAMVDITALGGPTVLVLVVLLTFGLLAVHRLWLTAWLMVAATATGGTAVELIKLHVDRARPEIVPHLVEAAGYSFPSGLGVHWPSDVLAGWSFGTLWALAWWLVAMRTRHSLAPAR
jgi:undecaprenyl-diphosphatase